MTRVNEAQLVEEETVWIMLNTRLKYKDLICWLSKEITKSEFSWTISTKRRLRMEEAVRMICQFREEPKRLQMPALTMVPRKKKRSKEEVPCFKWCQPIKLKILISRSLSRKRGSNLNLTKQMLKTPQTKLKGSTVKYKKSKAWFLPQFSALWRI